MQHLDEGTIHAWLDGALDADESARTERHVAECATCSEAVAEARGMIAGASRIVSALDVVPGNVIPRSSSGKTPPRGWLWRSLRLTPGRAALAAALLLAVGTMLTVRHAPTRDAVSAISTNAASEPAAPTAAEQPVPRNEAAAPASAPVATVDKKASSKTAPTSAPMAVAGNVITVGDSAARTGVAGGAAGGAARGVAGGIAGTAVSAPSVAALQEKAAAKPQAAINRLQEVVTTSAGVARAGDSLQFDTLKRRRVLALDSVRTTALPSSAREFAASRAGIAAGGGRTGRGSGFADAALRTNETSECYRVNSDSVAVSAVVFLPRLFSLQQNAGPPPQNVVRTVAPDGRIDSAIAGARWERLTPTTTRLYLTSGAKSSSTLTLQFADGRIAGQLSTPTGPRNIDVTRSTCRP